MTEIQQYQQPTDLLPGSTETRVAGSALIREAAAVMADARALAEVICRTSMVPDHFKGKTDETAAAILYGSSLGLDPMQAVKAVYVVHGNAALYGRSMDALVKAAGHQTWTIEAGPEKVVMGGRRRGSNTVETAEWTIERATKAGYVPVIDESTGKYAVNKNGKMLGNEKYLTDPETMLRAKATAEICRTIAPDVLNGVYSVEEREMEYIDAEVVTVRRPSAPSKGLAAALEQPKDDPAPTQITKAQISTMGQLMKQAGVDGKDMALAYVADVIGRQVERREDLSSDEAQAVNDALAAEVAEQQKVES
ncbi:hypothetical protein [Nocardioides panaciterrulae]|uniref:RecT-like ssDNA binding protein n=1 Tax=Nocardioides panaciterrulae TaxID=661492 RepID=A0A7Y9JD46_9ACTN|nr:hypothetical protein [Nocardioides panaciterrulae]NYD39939.1 hypothetical protein [Nocardioides panaciterrulae]NYD43971.1 hypothetical protein [Nocardioides panaciterrulae]